MCACVCERVYVCASVRLSTHSYEYVYENLIYVCVCIHIYVCVYIDIYRYIIDRQIDSYRVNPRVTPKVKG